jgi:hypothetical protein
VGRCGAFYFAWAARGAVLTSYVKDVGLVSPAVHLFLYCKRNRTIMATRHQVTCINKIPRMDRHRAITHIGGVNPDGRTWTLTQQEAIDDIEYKRREFYVQVGTHIANVIVSTHNGHKYLRTHSDSVIVDNLLSLPECR